jgi:hypothetical protein
VRCWDQDTLDVGPRNLRHTVPICAPQSDLFKDGDLTLTAARNLVCNLGEGSSELWVALEVGQLKSPHVQVLCTFPHFGGNGWGGRESHGHIRPSRIGFLSDEELLTVPSSESFQICQHGWNKYKDLVPLDPPHASLFR